MGRIPLSGISSGEIKIKVKISRFLDSKISRVGKLPSP
jgi:hypothetical protein